jgi:ABC-2 type transport system permease protein
VLGVAWTMLNPLLTMLAMTIVFSQVFRFSVQDYPVYVLSALTAWNFFAQTTVHSMNSLVWGGGLLGRVYIPRAIFAVSAAGTGLVNLFMAIIPLIIIMLFTGVSVHLTLLYLPIPILLMTMFTLGIGLFLSTLAIYFIDVVNMYEIILTIWFYLTPIVYPIDILPDHLSWILVVNPMYFFIELFRIPAYSGSIPGKGLLIPSIVYAISSLFIGAWFFSRKVDEIAYRV